MIFSEYHRIFLNLLVVLIGYTPTYCRHLQTEDVNAQLVSIIESYMDMTANPCDSFYKYACGNWMREYKYDYDLNIGDTITVLDHEYNQQLKPILAGGINSTKIETQAIFNKVHDFYESCREPKYFNIRRYLSLVKPTADDNWPEDGETWEPQEKWNIWSTMGRLATVGYNHLFIDFNLLRQTDSSYGPHLRPYELNYPQLGTFNDGYYFSNDDNVRRITLKMVKFGRQLQALYNDFGRKRVSSVAMTVSEYQQQTGTIDLFSYLSAFLGPRDVGNITVTFENMEYLRKLSELVEATPQEVLIHTLKKSFIFHLKQQWLGSEWDTQCVYVTRKLFPLAMDYLYNQAVYSSVSNATNAVIEKVFKSTQQKFKAIIQEHSDELSPLEIESLQVKVLKMKLNIGSLPQDLDDKLYMDYFQNWEMVKDDFFLSHVNALRHRYRDSYKLMQLNEFSPLRSLSQQLTPTPFYLVHSNIVVIPYAYIGYAMIQPQLHELFQYAELGNRLGHEMLRAFDTRGQNFDGEGHQWSVNVYEKPKFAAALKCLKQNSTHETNEKIADFSGLRLAYDTYFQQSEVPQYSGKSQLSNKQLYFVKFAQLLCASSWFGYDSDREWPTTRVPQAVENIPEFEEVFSCPPKTDAGVEKCKMW